MRNLLVGVLFVTFALVAPVAGAHIGTSGDCSYYDVVVSPKHWHVCASTVSTQGTTPALYEQGIPLLA